MRFLARETLAALKVRGLIPTVLLKLMPFKAKHPNHTDEEYAIPLARLLFYRYINPAIV